MHDYRKKNSITVQIRAIDDRIREFFLGMAGATPSEKIRLKKRALSFFIELFNFCDK